MLPCPQEEQEEKRKLALILEKERSEREGRMWEMMERVSAPAPPPKASPTSGLKKLKAMFEGDLITEAEYAQKKQAYLDQM
jgi:hypothetical protein